MDVRFLDLGPEFWATVVLHEEGVEKVLIRYGLHRRSTVFLTHWVLVCVCSRAAGALFVAARFNQLC